MLRAFNPFLVAWLRCFGWRPFYFVCPVGGGHWSAPNVFGVSGFERFALSCCLVGAYALLSEPDGFDLAARFSDDNMGLGGMVWGSLGLVVA